MKTESSYSFRKVGQEGLSDQLSLEQTLGFRNVESVKGMVEQQECSIVLVMLEKSRAREKAS